MAKLSGVKVVAERIEFEGAEYTKVDRKAQAGDIVRITDEDALDSDSDLTDGGFYRVEEVDSWDDPQVMDDVGDERDLAGWKYEVYVKVVDVAEPCRRLTVGDYARVVRNTVAHDYEIGSVVKIVEDDEDACPYKGERADGSVGNFMYEEDVEPATEAEFLAQKQPAEAAEDTGFITYEGGTYRKTTRKAEAGDLIYAINRDSNCDDYEVGDVFETYMHGERLVYRRRDRRDYYHQSYDHSANFVVLEKVTEPAADTVVHNGVTYRKVARKANVGDIVVITSSESKYPVGSVHRLVNDQGTRGYGETCFGVGSTYVVRRSHIAALEPVKAEAAPAAPQYVEVSRKARVGERIRIVDAENTHGRYKNGDVLTVRDDQCLPGNKGVEVAEFIQPKIYDREYIVLEPAEPKPPRLKVGDYAKVTKGGALGSYRSVGDIVKITEDDRSSVPFNLEHVDGRYAGWAYESDLVRATDEEVTAAKDSLDPRNKFAVGDKVRLINGGGDHPLTGFRNGEIYEVSDPKTTLHSGKRVQITHADKYRGFATPDQIVKVTEPETPQIGDFYKVVRKGESHDYDIGAIVRVTEVFGGESPLFHGVTVSTGVAGNCLSTEQCVRATPEEVAVAQQAEAERIERIEREATERKWAAIGRKVNEYKAGDIVRVTNSGPLATGKRIMNGDIVEVGEFEGDLFRLLAPNVTGGNFARASMVELVVPVEQRFDK